MGTKMYSMEPISVFFFYLSAPVRTTTHEWIRKRVSMIYVFVFILFTYIHACICILFFVCFPSEGESEDFG